MKIVHLINDTYQVVSEDEQTIYFQGSKEECNKYIYPCILEDGCDGIMCHNCIKKHELNKSE